MAGMAGGMGARDRGLTLAERSGAAAADRRPPGACHCWVLEDGQRLPGLLLEWRRRSGRWEGLVAYLIPGAPPDTHSLMQQWLDSERLRSAGRRA
jgi:hypothetical protein